MILIDKNYLEKYGVPDVDYHIHTKLSDGEGSIEDCVIQALRKNLKEMAITEHVWKTSDWISLYLQKIKNAREKYNFPIYAGIEAKVINMNGEVDATEDTIKKMRIVMGAVHRYPSDEDYKFLNLAGLTSRKAAEIETQVIFRLIKNPWVNVIAHPTRSYYKFFPHSKQNFPIEYLLEIALMAKKHNVALEWNNKWGRDYILELYLDTGVPILLGSDAHSPDEIGNIGKNRILSLLEKYRREKT